MEDVNELLISLESGGKSMYQHIYREAAGVYWDQKNHEFKSTPIKEWSCSQWFSHIVSVVKLGIGVELQLSKNAIWQNVLEEDKADIIQKYSF
jgi:hypothetical protein